MNMETIIPMLIALLIGGAVLIFAIGLPKLKGEVPSEDRAYMDPLPPLLRLSWPLIRFLEYHLCQFIPADSLEKTHKRLAMTGVSYLVNAEQFYAIRLLSTLGAFGAMWLCLHLLETTSVNSLLVALLVGYFYPDLWLSDVRGRRAKAVQRTRKSVV